MKIITMSVRKSREVNQLSMEKIMEREGKGTEGKMRGGWCVFEYREATKTG